MTDYEFPKRTSTDPLESPAPADRRWRLRSEPIPDNLGYVWAAIDTAEWEAIDPDYESVYTGPVMLVNTVFATNKFVTHWMPAFIPLPPEYCAFEALYAKIEQENHG